MKTFRQLINEVLASLNEETAQVAVPASNSGEMSFIRLLYNMKPSSAGNLFGECVNIFTSTPITEIEILVPEKNIDLYVFGAYTENEPLKHKMPTGKKAIYVTKKDIDDLCSIIDRKTMIHNIISAENRKQTYSFSSSADPSPHEITDKMFGTKEKKEMREVQVPATKNSYARKVKKLVGTGVYVRNGNLALSTIYTGKGVHSGKKIQSMEVGRGGRHTAAISNNYYINGHAKLFIKFNDRESYLICIDKNRSTDSTKANSSSGSLNNVAIFNTQKEKTSDDLFYNTSFLNAAARQLALNSEEIYDILNSGQNVESISNVQQPKIAYSNDVKPFSSTIKELIQKARRYAHLYNNATDESAKANWLEKWREVCNLLISNIKQDYPSLSLPENEYGSIPKQVKEHLKKLQQARKTNKNNTIDVRSAFRKKYY